MIRIGIMLLFSLLNSVQATTIEHKLWDKDLLPSQFDAFLKGEYTHVNGDVSIIEGSLQSLSALKHLEKVFGDVVIAISSPSGQARDNASLTGLEQLMVVTGRLSIKNNPYLSDLSALNHLNQVETLLIENNPQLTSLHGLNHLRVAGIRTGGLRIVKNPSLTDLTALKRLQRVHTLFIRENNVLLSLNGLQGVTHVLGDLLINRNDGLFNCQGLNNLELVKGTVNISNHTKLTDFKGLDSLRYVGQWFKVEFNDVLNSFEGLERLEEINSTLKIHGNPKLSSLNGLTNLQVISHNFQLSNLPKLTSFQGLSSLHSIGGELEQWGTPMLTSFKGMEQLTTLGGLHIQQAITTKELPNLEYIDILNIKAEQGKLTHKQRLLPNLKFVNRAVFFPFEKTTDVKRLLPKSVEIRQVSIVK